MFHNYSFLSRLDLLNNELSLEKYFLKGPFFLVFFFQCSFFIRSEMHTSLSKNVQHKVVVVQSFVASVHLHSRSKCHVFFSGTGIGNQITILSSETFTEVPPPPPPPPHLKPLPPFPLLAPPPPPKKKNRIHQSCFFALC